MVLLDCLCFFWTVNSNGSTTNFTNSRVLPDSMIVAMKTINKTVPSSILFNQISIFNLSNVHF